MVEETVNILRCQFATSLRQQDFHHITRLGFLNTSNDVDNTKKESLKKSLIVFLFSLDSRIKVWSYGLLYVTINDKFRIFVLFET